MIKTILSSVGGLFNSAVWIVLGVLLLTIAGGYFWIQNLKGEIADHKTRIQSLQVDIQNLQETNKHQAVIIKDLSSELVVQADAFAKKAKLLEKIRVKFVPVLREIERAPETDNGPLAPVLRNTIDRLRQLREERARSSQDGDRSSGISPGTPGGGTSPGTTTIAR